MQDKLSQSGINNLLDENFDIRVEVLDSVSSTNVELEKRADEAEGLILVARQQTAGKGTKGRNFSSAKGVGTYFSILLKPKNLRISPMLLTPLAGVVVCEAIEKYSNLSPKIKWVNDIYVDNKKVCGILTQSSFSAIAGDLDYIIVGIGINVYNHDNGYPDDIKHVAGALFDEKKAGLLNEITAEVINRFFRYYYDPSKSNFINKYKDYSLLIGRDIVIHDGLEQRDATVTGVNDECQLIVRYSNGNVGTLSAGDVSIRI